MKTQYEKDLFTLLIKNLPAKVHASDNKSGAYSKAALNTSYALKNSNFVEFNSKERITIAVFDKDQHEGKTALEYFGDIFEFEEWLLGMIDIMPNYICQTTKGFQFAFVINGFLTVQSGHSPKNPPENYLSDIKTRFIKHLELDSIASSRNHAIFRNPLKHKYIAYPSTIYDLNDLNECLLDETIDNELSSYTKSSYIKVSKYTQITSNRNNSIFLLCCREFAYSKPLKREVFNFAKGINDTLCYEPLSNSEIKSITQSIYKRTQDESLKNGSATARKNRANLIKGRISHIIKFFLNCMEKHIKPTKAQLAKELGISVVTLNNNYKELYDLKYKKYKALNSL